MFARVCRFGHIGGQNETRARRRGWLYYYDNDRGRGMTADYYDFRVAVSNENIILSHRSYIIFYYIYLQNRVYQRHDGVSNSELTNWGVDEGREAR